MNELYGMLAAMSAAELKILARDLDFYPDPWAVGARKLVAAEILLATHTRNKIFTF